MKCSKETPDFRSCRRAHPIWIAAIICVAAGKLAAQSVPRAPWPMTGDADTVAQLEAVEDVALAAELATVGIQKQYPLSLVAAAQLLRNNPIRALLVNRRENRSAAAVRSNAPSRPRRAPLDPARLLEAARQMSQSDSTTLAVVNRLAQRRTRSTRGASGGPRALEDSVAAGATVEYQIPFDDGKPAVVTLVGDGSTSLRCYAYDSTGSLLASDRSGRRRCSLKWRANSAAAVRVAVENPGSASTNYLLITN